MPNRSAKITPYSQFVCTQAAINVATGQRYKHVIDDMILFAKGTYGEDSKYPWMDQNLRDRLLGLPRAKELVVRERPDVPLEKIRGTLGGVGVSDDEFLLRYIMKGEDEIRAMRAAPLVKLLDELGKHRQVRYIRVERGGNSLVVRNRAAV